MLILGIDPALINTGWGVISYKDNNLKYIASGTIKISAKNTLDKRLKNINSELQKILDIYKPDICAIEETFVNKNPVSSLKLGHARGAIILTVAMFGIEITEYPANKIKKTVTGAGKADKEQVQAMIKVLLPTADCKTHDEADALAVAICHSSYS